ncbi:HEPN domain-containing protein [Achromobacter aegrifaciens]
MLTYTLPKKKKASTLLSLGLSELEAAENLIEAELYREAVVHLYFCAYYVSQALLQNELGAKSSHEAVERMLHKIYGKSRWFRRRYVDLHSFLHNLRNEFNYKATHVPNPRLLQKKLTVLRAYVAFAFRHVPKVETLEILRAIYQRNENSIKDFSYDIYCPKTYAHHTRVTFWQPPFYLDIFSVEKLSQKSKEMLKSLNVRRHEDYVVGLNSRLDQYKPVQLIMLDIDSVDSAVEHELKSYGGVLLKSGRGFHFIAHRIFEDQALWIKEMKKFKRIKALKGHLDENHIDISLKRGYSTLRITSSSIKPTIPVFYKEL